MMRGRGTLSAALIAISPIPVFAQQLWNGTSQGMNPDAVLKLFPEAQRPTHPGRNNVGDVELLRIDRKVLEGYHTRVRFYFYHGLLASDSTLIGGPDDPTEIDGLRIENYLNGMSAVLGPKRCQRWKKNGFTWNIFCYWKFEGTSIGAFANFYNHMIYVIYKPWRPSDKQFQMETQPEE